MWNVFNRFQLIFLLVADLNAVYTKHLKCFNEPRDVYKNARYAVVITSTMIH